MKMNGGDIIPLAEQTFGVVGLVPVVTLPEGNGGTPFGWFYNRRSDYSNINPALVVRLAQYATGTALNEQDRHNLHGWVQEEATRLQARTGEQ